MKANNVDVYVLIKNENAEAPIAPVVEKIRQSRGVHKASMNQRVGSLMAVQYDPAAISSQAILASIRQQGYRASLIGM